jgi:predicted lipase
MELSAAAYRDIQPYISDTCTKMIADKKSNIEYFLRRGKDTLQITFRGTDSPRNWKTDLTFWKKTIPYNNADSKIRVHTGFINAYKRRGVRDKILSSIGDDTHYVKISGHSMGAALAVLCAVDIQFNFPDRDIQVFLFGCPRIGNKAFMLSYNKRVEKTVSIENGNDIVTKLPFAFMGYRHVGAKLNIGAFKLPFILSANDHYPHKYYSGLLKKFMP